MMRSCLFVLSIVVICACTKPAPTPPVGLAGAHEQQAVDVVPQKATILKGKVTELIQHGDFSYLNLECEDGKSRWIALLHGKIKLGEKISIEADTTLSNFHSKALNRTFKQLVFGRLHANF